MDFVLKNKDNSLTGINITYTDSIDTREAKALLEFKEEFKDKVLKLIIITNKIEKSEYGIIYIPFWKWLLELSPI